VATFCLSDIVGSTALWERDARAMAAALVRHDELVAGAVESHGGRFLKSKGEGDATFSVFESAPGAVAAAVAAKRAADTHSTTPYTTMPTAAPEVTASPA
jgi:class 3 adenylate cyclase